MNVIGFFKAKKIFDSLLDRVEHGEEILITRHNKPVARLVPIEPKTDCVQARIALDKIRARVGCLNGGFDWQQVKGDRDSGRP